MGSSHTPPLRGVKARSASVPPDLRSMVRGHVHRCQRTQVRLRRSRPTGVHAGSADQDGDIWDVAGNTISATIPPNGARQLSRWTPARCSSTAARQPVRPSARPSSPRTRGRPRCDGPGNAAEADCPAGDLCAWNEPACGGQMSAGNKAGACIPGTTRSAADHHATLTMAFFTPQPASSRRSARSVRAAPPRTFEAGSVSVY